MKFSAAEPLTVAITRSPVKGRYYYGHVSRLAQAVLLRACLTLPVFDSTEAAFFLLSVTSAPAIVAVTVSGGVCRKPGPKVKVFFLPVPVGNALFGMSSPGRTIVAAMMRKRKVASLYKHTVFRRMRSELIPKRSVRFREKCTSVPFADIEFVSREEIYALGLHHQFGILKLPVAVHLSESCTPCLFEFIPILYLQNCARSK